jgi:hypothetical protein
MKMDHETAIQTRAAERYALGETAGEEDLEFEAHFFDCALCAEDVKAASGFVTNARVWFEEQRAAESREAAQPARRSARWNWFRPIWLSPAFATLFAVLAGYSWLVTVPRLRQERPAADAVGVYQPVLLRAQTRGEALPIVRVAPGSPVALTLNIESDREYPNYEVETLNASGASISKQSVPPGLTITVILSSARLGNGTYTIIVRGGPDGRPEIGRYQFEIRKASN